MSNYNNSYIISCGIKTDILRIMNSIMYFIAVYYFILYFFFKQIVVIK